MLSGTAYTHPDYSNFTDLRNWNDVGLIVLDKPVAGIAAASLPSRGFLGAVAQPKLNSTLFTVVGYGTEVRKPVSGPQKPQPMSYPLVRRVTTSPGQKLTSQILQLNGVINDVRGGGGTCFGDSGGPVFLNGYLVADTSYGYTEQLPLPRRLPAAGHQERPGLAGDLRPLAPNTWPAPSAPPA